MRGYIDMTGKTYGRLTVIGRDPNPPKMKYNTFVWWLCNCSCGGKTTVRGSTLRNGETKSCGCLRVELCTKRFAEPRRKYPNRKEKQKASYHRHKEYHREKDRKRYDRGNVIIQAAKDKPCKDCGKQYHFSLMDFDHLPGTEKDFSISSCIGRKSLEKLQEEIGKCEVVCALCHRVRTWNRTHPDAITLNC